MKGEEQGWSHLERLNNRLAERLARINTLSFIRQAGEYLRNIRRPGIGDTNLSSPVRQIFHLFGLLLSRSPVNAGEVSLPDWIDLLKEVERLYQQLCLVFFPAVDEFPTQSRSWWRSREVAMPAFLDYFNTIPLLYKEQSYERIERWFGPYDHSFHGHIGLTSRDAMDIFEYVTDEHRQKIKAALEKQAATIQAIRAQDKDRFLATRDQLVATLGDLYIVSRSDLNGKFSEETVTAFLSTFSLDRGPDVGYCYPTATNPTLLRPLARLDHELYGFIDPSVFPNAIIETFTSLVADSDFKQSFYRHRASDCVNKAQEVFREFLPDDCAIWQEFSVVHDTGEAAEHDLLIRLPKNRFLAVEIKSTPPKEPFRNPDKAFTRIERAFRSDTGIQGAYFQARCLAEHLEAETELRLLNSNGSLLEILPPGPRVIRCICLTADSFGALATDLSLLLEKEDQGPYPWAVCLPDLETALHGMTYRGKDVDDFMRFLDERSQLHGIVASSGDELEFVGAFLQFNSLKPVLESGMDSVVLDIGFSDLFDEIYAREHGAPLPPPQSGDAQACAT